ncbi:MAG: ATP-binding cassette domain-containing protein, partial [Chloroflexi bacterium]|nr:ATP-binding cassette domain-containing protein [Chloroflexota bacterium]
YDVNTGRILIDDIDIRNLSLSTLRKNIGIVQQDTFLFAATIRENITYGAGNIDFEKVKTVAKAAQLHDFIEALPEGYNTWVGERGVTLSGGEKQRLSIARTLIINPPILIFDDSTSSVDFNTEYKIYSAISNLVRNRTTFIITNRLSIVKNADLILVLDNGRIIEQGNHNELMRKHGLYEEIHRLQLSISNIDMDVGIEDA